MLWAGAQMLRLGWILILTVSLGRPVFAAPSCSTLANGDRSLPSRLPVVVLNTSIYRDPRVNPSEIVNTVYAPGVEIGSDRAVMHDLNQVWFPNVQWQAFVIGDGSVRRSFNSVDLRPGSSLNLWVERFFARRALERLPSRDEDLIRFLAYDFSSDQYLGWTQHAYLGDGRAELPWDRQIKVDPDLRWDFGSMLGRPVSLDWWTTRQQEFPVVPLEKYLEIGKGYCLQRSVVVSAILSARGISHRIVNGLLDEGPGKTGGHTWIALADGRILDPSMNLLARPKRNHKDHANWEYIGVGYRFESQIYPALRFH